MIALKIVFKKANWKEEFLYFWRFRLWFYLSRSYGFPLTGMVLQVNGAQIDITGGIKKCPEKHVKDIFFTWWHMHLFLKYPKFEHFQFLSLFCSNSYQVLFFWNARFSYTEFSCIIGSCNEVQLIANKIWSHMICILYGSYDMTHIVKYIISVLKFQKFRWRHTRSKWRHRVLIFYGMKGLGLNNEKNRYRIGLTSWAHIFPKWPQFSIFVIEKIVKNELFWASNNFFRLSRYHRIRWSYHIFDILNLERLSF